MRTAEFIEFLKRNGMYFEHDGHPDRPYPLLTSGHIADGYIDITTDDPAILEIIAMQMLHRVNAPLLAGAEYIVGLPYASLYLGYELARRLRRKTAFLEFSRTEPDAMIVQRYQRYLEGKRVILVDNAMTTGGTLQVAVDLLASIGATVDSILCVANWSGGRVLPGTHIPVHGALEPKFTMWKPGENPLVERVLPLKPKVGNNWEVLTREYP